MPLSYLLATDHQCSVTRNHGGLMRAYTPYGALPHQDGPNLAFCGDRRDPLTGCYHLGNGHRQFNPVLMRFHSTDALSPFGAGGVNCYAFCAGDPVNRVDPSGAAWFVTMRRNNSIVVPRGASQTPAIGQGDIMNYAVQGVFTVNNGAGVINNVVGAMELIQRGAAANQTTTNRLATIADFWSYAISLGTRASSVIEIAASPLPLEVISYSSRFAMSSGVSGMAAYAELPGRIHQLWQNSTSVGGFAALALRGAGRASGVDLVGLGVARSGRSLVNTARAGRDIISSIFQDRQVVITIRRSSANHETHL